VNVEDVIETWVAASDTERFLARELVKLQDENRQLRRDNQRLERTVAVLSETLAESAKKKGAKL
jgi:cell division protein FtsB